MSNNSYQQYHQQLIEQLAKQVKQTSPFNGDDLDEVQEKFIKTLDALSTSLSSEDAVEQGQWLICTIVANYPHYTPIVARDLFWYFGGECMHYLTDEEITYFQTLDERYHDSLSKEEEHCDYEQLVAQSKAPYETKH